MSSTSTIAPIVSLPKKSNKTTSLTKASATPSKKSSASSDKKNQRKHNKKTSSSSSLDGHSSSTQTESDDTDKSSTSQRKKRSRRGRRQNQQQQKRSSAQPKPQQENSTPSLPVNMKRRRRSNSAIIYAGPHFMNDAPLPSSLPLPGASLSAAKTTMTTTLPIEQQYQPLLQLQNHHRPTLYERSLAGENMDSKLLSSHKSYLMDPISEIQEKLRTMLKIQA